MKKILLILGLLMFLGCTSMETNKKKEHYLIKGMNYSRSNEYTKAIEEYKSFYKIDQKNAILLREMGFAYAQLGKYKTAENYYLKALKLDPQDQNLLSNMAILYYKMQKLDLSKKYISKISVDGMTFEVYLLKGYIAYDEKKYEDAYKDFRSVLSLIEIEDCVFADKYVVVLQKTNRTDEIYNFIYQIYQAEKNNPDSVIKYSRHLINIYGDYDGGLRVLKTYISKGKNDRVILETAVVSFEIGKVNDADLYLKLLTNAYKYNVDVLKLKKEIAIKKNNTKDIEKYTKILEKVDGTNGETN